MTKFHEAFKSPWMFTDGTFVIDGELPREQAALEISAELGATVDPAALRVDRVRFGFPPEFVEDRENFDGPIWYTGAGEGKGTKPVWVYDPRG